MRAVVFCHGLFGQGRNWTAIGKALAAGPPGDARGPARPRSVAVERPVRLPRRRRPGGRAARASGRPGRAGRALDGRQGRDAGGAAPSRARRAARRGRRRPGALRPPRRVRRLHRGDAGPRPRHAWSGAARPTRRCARRCPTTTVRGFLLQSLRRDGDGVGAGGSTSTCSGGTSRDQRLAGGPARRHWRRTTARCCGSAASGRRTSADEHVAAMDRWFPRNRRVTVKDAGHWVHSEQPQVFVEVLRRFLAQRSLALPGAVGGDRVAVAAGGRAVAPGAVAGQVEHDALAVGVGADRRAGTSRRCGSRRSSPSRSRPRSGWPAARRGRPRGCASRTASCRTSCGTACASSSMALTISTAVVAVAGQQLAQPRPERADGVELGLRRGRGGRCSRTRSQNASRSAIVVSVSGSRPELASIDGGLQRHLGVMGKNHVDMLRHPA